MTPRCPHGHLFTPSNTRWYMNDGKPYRQCRACASSRMRLKYRDDEAYREKKKNSGLARYYARRDGPKAVREEVQAKPQHVGHTTV